MFPNFKPPTFLYETLAFLIFDSVTILNATNFTNFLPSAYSTCYSILRVQLHRIKLLQQTQYDLLSIDH